MIEVLNSTSFDFYAKSEPRRLLTESLKKLNKQHGSNKDLQKQAWLYRDLNKEGIFKSLGSFKFA